MIVREFREAWRRLMRRPGYALLSVGMLGVGLGVVLFLFGLVNTMILRPLPFPQAGRLMAIGQQQSNGIGYIDSDQYLQLVPMPSPASTWTAVAVQIFRAAPCSPPR
jgi:hypothetical protein